MKTPLFILLLMLPILFFGQHKADTEVNSFITKAKIDTFAFVSTGCTECVPSYEDISRITDIATIKLLYRENGADYLAIFSDTSSVRFFGKRNTQIFDFISSNIQVLNRKEPYYKEAKLAKFQPPCLFSFPYESVYIKLGKFGYNHTAVLLMVDSCGTIQTNQDWFQVELKILRLFDTL